MFCTTFSENPSEDVTDINLGGCLGPLYCHVLPNDELYRPLSSSLIELSTADGEGACILMGKILLDINMAVLEENGSLLNSCVPHGQPKSAKSGKHGY